VEHEPEKVKGRNATTERVENGWGRVEWAMMRIMERDLEYDSRAVQVQVCGTKLAPEEAHKHIRSNEGISGAVDFRHVFKIYYRGKINRLDPGQEFLGLLR